MPTSPPEARRGPDLATHHQRSWPDPYRWLRTGDPTEIRRHLDAENSFLDELLDPALVTELTAELRARVVDVEPSVPERDGPWWYYSRFEPGAEHVTHLRAPAVPANDWLGTAEHFDVRPVAEETVLDAGALVVDGAYLDVGDVTVSPDHSKVAYLLDRTGDERYELVVVALDSGARLLSEVADVASVAWAVDSATLYVCVQDDARRPHELWRLRLDGARELVLRELDERFWLDVSLSRSGRWLVVTSEASASSEAHLLDASDPAAAPRLVRAREDGHLYCVDHAGVVAGADTIVVLSFGADPAGQVLLAPTSEPSTWTEVLGADPELPLDSVDCYAGHVVICRRRNGLPELVVLGWDDRRCTPVPVPSPAGTVTPWPLPSWESTTVRFAFETLIDPSAVYDADLGTTVLRRRWITPVPGYDPSRYTCMRITVPAADGTCLPVDVAYRADLDLAAAAGTALYGYGSYGLAWDPWFSTGRPSLLDRGVVFALAHPRGGGEFGRPWHDAARREHKLVTTQDFLDSAAGLVAAGLAVPGRIVIRGGSAGGTLVAAALNAAPELLAGVVAEVPFVDVCNTMCDPTLPQVVAEYDEWGDPAAPGMLDALIGWDPIGNIAPGHAYPPVLATAGFHDPRVSYWEPAKWVATLRYEAGPDASPAALRTTFDGGHQGRSGRYGQMDDEAQVLAFVLAALTR